MLKIRILKGSGSGQSFSLKAGENTVGRGSTADIVLASNGVSKMHAKFIVQGDQCVLTDMGSSNGTFVNGTKVKDRILRVGDKIAFHDVIVELTNDQAEGRHHAPQMPQQIPSMPPGNWNQGAALQYQQPQQYGYPQMQGQPQMQMSGQPQQQTAEPHGAIDFIKAYVEKVILPGVYYLAEMYPLKHVMGAFFLAFILLVTTLSSIPMAELTKDGIQKESLRRAMTIARQLAAVSERALASGGEPNVRTDFAENEDGVQIALVISREDGHIIAPVTKQEYSSDSFVTRARKYDKDSAESLGGSLIGAAAPIRSFSADSGGQVITAMSVIIYKMDTVDWSATTAVFARVLIIALIIGSAIFFLLYNLIAHPVKVATGQLDQALRGEKDLVQVKFNFDEFDKLISNINSAISRMGQPNSQNALPATDRNAEAANLVRIVTDPSFALDRDVKFLEVNEAFGDLTGMRQISLQGQGLDALSDQALRLQLEDLVQRGRAASGTIVQSELEISGNLYDIFVTLSMDAVNPGELSYVFGTIKKRSQA